MSDLDHRLKDHEAGPSSLFAVTLWPTYLLLAFSWPLWIALRGSFGSAGLRITVFSVFLAPLITLGLTVLLAASQSEEEEFSDHPFFEALAGPLWPWFAVETPLLVGALGCWLGLMLAHNFLAPLFYRERRLPKDSGGRFILLPHDQPEGRSVMLYQWLIVVSIAACAVLNPPELQRLPDPLPKLAEFSPGVVTNAVAFIILSGLTYLNGGHYPGLPRGPGLKTVIRARPFRFISELTSRTPKSQGLPAIFSRRNPALRKIVDPDQN